MSNNKPNTPFQKSKVKQKIHFRNFLQFIRDFLKGLAQIENTAIFAI
jgi:hypothetical protein